MPISGHAQRAHVFGPDGSPTERRVFLVFERADGSCAPADDVAFSVQQPGVAIEPLVSAGCVHTIRVTSQEPRTLVRLNVRAGDEETSATVSLGPRIGLELSARRMGERIIVDLPPDAESPWLSAHWADGTAEMVRMEGSELRFETDQPPREALVVVVARVGDEVGVAAVAPASARRREALVVPTARSVPSNGTPRAAALVVVTDNHGELSSTIPLRIQSERGALRALDWLRPGIASVTLSTSSLEPTLDLRVSVAGDEVVALIPILRGWPEAAVVLLPEQPPLVGVPFEVRVSATTADGEPIPTARLRVRCAAEEVSVDARGVAACTHSQAGSLTIGAVVRVDGVSVPMGWATAAIAEAIAAAPVASPQDTSTRISIRGLLRAGIDGWLRPTLGAGVGVSFGFSPLVELAFSTRYGAIIVESAPGAQGGASLRGSLEAVDHLFVNAVSVELRPLSPLVLAASGGVEVSALDGTLAGADVSAVDIRPFAELAAGIEVELDRTRLGVRAGIWAGAEQVTPSAWGTAPVRGFVEVVGGIAP